MATFAILAFLVGILLIVTPGLVVTILVTLANDVQTVDRVLSTSSLLDSNLADQLASTRISFEADSPTAVHCTNEYHRLVSNRQTMPLEFDSLQRRLVIAKPGIAIHSKLTDSFVQVVAPVYNCKRAEANACTPKWNHNLFWALSIAAT